MKSEENLNSSLKKIAKTSLIVLAGIIFSKIFAYIYKIIIARNFGQEMYGVFSLATMISIIVASFFSLGLQSGLLRYISLYRGKDEKDKIKYIIRLSIKISLPVSIIAGVLLFIFSDIISIKIFHHSELSVFIRWFSFSIPILILGGIFHAITRAYEKIKPYVFIGSILAMFIQVISFVILVFLRLRNEAIIFSYNLGILSIFVASLIVCRLQIPHIFKKPNIDKQEGRKLAQDLFSYSWPVMFLGLVTLLFSGIDSFSIGYFKTVAEVGLYNAAAPISLLLQLVPALFLQFFLPLITKEYYKKNFSLINDLSKQIGKWIFILNLPLLIIMILFPGAVINLLFGPEYINAANALRFLSVGMFFYSILLVSENLLSMAGKSKITLLNFVISCILNIILNILLVPKYGINGAAFSTMLSYGICSLLSLLMAKHYTSIIPLKKKMIRIFLVALIPAFILFFIRNFLEMNLIILILLGSLFILSYFALILITKCFDENDLLIIQEIKNQFLINKTKN
jgi:O-antigen/teichoic acid export membrane protein